MPAAALREVPETLVGFHPSLFPFALRAERPLPARLQSIRQCGQGLRAGIAGRDCGRGSLPAPGLGEEPWAGSPTQEAWSGRTNQRAALPIKVLPVSSWGG